jgi:RNA polymerase sigma-54 factor
MTFAFIFFWFLACSCGMATQTIELMLYQNLVQKQQLKIHPLQLQMLNLFHLNSIELEQRIQQELEENPIIEEKKEEQEPVETSEDPNAEYQDWDEYAYDDIPDYRVETPQFSQQMDMPDKPIVETMDFRKEVISQFRMLNLSEEEKHLGEFIINSLSDEGFLENSYDAIVDDYSLKFSKWIDESAVRKIVKVIQELDPIGVGTSSIKECLLIQLYKMNVKSPDVKTAIALLEGHYEEMKQRSFNKIYAALNIDEEDLKIVLELIASLKLKPVAAYENTPTQFDTIIPDFIVTEEGDELIVALTKERSPHLSINASWKARVNDMDKEKRSKGESQYFKNKLSAAEWFVTAIKQRESTMAAVMRTIVNLQEDYFRTGDESLLKPMILKNVADRVGVDISTVSRITCNKYVQTPFGNVLLKNLFNEGLENQAGELVSVKKIQETLGEVIDQEDKNSPYSDQQIAVMLAQKGLKIARRTVAKYREELKIPTAQLRSLWVQQKNALSY